MTAKPKGWIVGEGTLKREGGGGRKVRGAVAPGGDFGAKNRDIVDIRLEWHAAAAVRLQRERRAGVAAARAEDAWRHAKSKTLL